MSSRRNASFSSSSSSSKKATGPHSNQSPGYIPVKTIPPPTISLRQISARLQQEDRQHRELSRALLVVESMSRLIRRKMESSKLQEEHLQEAQRSAKLQRTVLSQSIS
ncbi:MAG: hypothetical protein Q8P67_20210, partial [archaeon]|nr:hypothetical protein [archaeon]